MEFEEFTQKYPALSRQQIATVAGCGTALVDRWFMQGATRKQPSEDHKIRFDIADWIWQQENLEPEFIKKLRRMNPTLSK